MADQSNPANAQSPEGRSDEAAERSSVNAPREHGPPQRADPPAATAADDETPAKSRPPADSPALQPGNPLFKNPFSDEADSKRSTLVPYFQIMDRFQALAEEYPDVSALWQAEFGRWRVWPLPFRDAKILSEHISRSEDVPYAPGADLHLDYNAIGTVDRLIIDAGIKHDQLNKILIRDRWLATDKFSPSDLWLHSIREFWLSAQEDAEASGADKGAFEKAAQADGYVPGTSTAVGHQVWSLMASQHKSLKQIVKERQLSTGDEINSYEQPAGWLESGTIPHVFAASAYFCGVLAARRASELESATTTTRATPDGNVSAGDQTIYLNAPVFRYEYSEDFPATEQMGIERARLEANEWLEKEPIDDYAGYAGALTEWSWRAITGAALQIGIAGAKQEWGANRRRDELLKYAKQVTLAAGIAGRNPNRFDDLVKSSRWQKADNLLLAPTALPAQATERQPNECLNTTPTAFAITESQAEFGKGETALHPHPELPDETEPALEMAMNEDSDDQLNPTATEDNEGTAERSKVRSDWMDERQIEHPWCDSDIDIAAESGLTYNTVRRYRSGVKSRRDLYVRRGLAKAFNCDIREVPE